MYRYQKLLYNSDCILDTKSNTVFFEGDDGWDTYQQWIKDYPILEEDIEAQKVQLLRWNQGRPIYLDDTKYHYHRNGILFKTETDNIYCEYDNDGFLIKKETTTDNGKEIEEYVVVNKKSLLSKRITPSETIHYQATPHQAIYKKYKQNGFNIEEYLSNNKIYKSSFTKNSIRVEKQFANGYTTEAKTYVDDILVKEKFYFSGTSTISKKNHKLRTEDAAGYYYTEYYPTTNCRAEGLLTENDKPTGVWKFYHVNGEVESEHFFNDGRFEQYSRSSVYYEDGTLNFNIKHD